MIHQSKTVLSVLISIYGLYLFYKLMFKPKHEEKTNKFIHQNSQDNEETYDEILWDCKAEENA